jgi:hypothetical protein
MIVSLRHLGVPAGVASIVAGEPGEAARQLQVYRTDAEVQHHGRRVPARHLVDHLRHDPARQEAFVHRDSIRSDPESRLILVPDRPWEMGCDDALPLRASR